MGRPIGSRDKIRRKFTNSFARQFLADHKIKMYSGNEQILSPVEKLYNIKLPNTRYYIGEQFIEPGETKKINSYEELKDLGFVIVSTQVDERSRWSTGQKVMYLIKRIDETNNHLDKMPKNHYIEYDSYNHGLRLIGPRSGPMKFGPWLRIDQQKLKTENAGRKTHITKLSENADMHMNKMMLKWRGLNEKPKPVYIKEAAFMITDANEIVCFPNIPDMPSILITGMKGTGKCIVQDAKTDFVLDGLGRWTKIEEKPKTIISMDENLKLKKSKVKKYFKRNVDEVIYIGTRHNKEIMLTPEHPLFTILGWKKAEELSVGDYIATSRKYDLELEKKIKNSDVKLLAYLIAAGKLDRGAVKLSYKYNDYDVLVDLKNAILNFDDELYIKNRFIRSHKKQNSLNLWLESMKLKGVGEKNKFIPNKIMELCNSQIKIFLATYFSVRGHAGNNCFNFDTQSKVVARQIQHLLLRFSIISKIHTRIRRYKYKTRNNNFKCYYVSIMNSEGIKKFVKIIKPLPKYKELQILKKGDKAEKIKKGFGLHDVVPKDVLNLFKVEDWFPVYKELGYYLKINQRNNPKYNMTLLTFKKMAKALKNPILDKISNSDIFWDKIEKIKVKKGNFTVWDIEVDNPTHNFVANDIIVHNSYCLHSLVSRFFWKPEFGYKIVILNDSSRETGTWCLPNNNLDQINILNRLNEKPLPLPCVYLHPLVKEDYEKLYMGDVGFDVTIPFKNIIQNHRLYLNLKESTRYFSKIAEELEDCRTQEAAERVFDEMVLHQNIPPQSANKIRAEFDTIFDAKLTDISTKGQKPWSTSKNKEKYYNPITASIHAGLLPVLETEFISNYRQLLSIYFSYFVGDLFNRQKQDPAFLAEKSEVLFVIDEAHNISQKGMKSGADLLLRRSVREGRPRRIGTLLATQKFGELPDVIKDNTTYLICFKSHGEAALIVNQYNMGKQRANEIKDLDKHQCLAYTTDHFIIYDSNGRKRKSKLNEVFIGRTLPPYSMHKRPKGGE